MMGKTKEVDEWVETGEADNGQKRTALAGKAGSPDKRRGPLNEGLRGAAGDDDQELNEDGKSEKDDAEDESWMFKTFSKVNMASKGKEAKDHEKKGRQQAARQDDFSDPFLEAGLSDLLQFDSAPAFQYPPPSSCGDGFLPQNNFELPNFDNLPEQNPNAQPSSFNNGNFHEPPSSHQPPMSFNHPQQFFPPAPPQQQPSSLAKKPSQPAHPQDFMNLNVNMNITNFNINYNFGQQQSQQQT